MSEEIKTIPKEKSWLEKRIENQKARTSFKYHVVIEKRADGEGYTKVFDDKILAQNCINEALQKDNPWRIFYWREIVF